jgi:serine/threonine-protein kinase
MSGPLPPERVIHLLTQTCEALAEAHSSGLVHRDIKPANIFAANRGGVYDVAKLLDFGLAKPLSNFSDVSLTAEGTITGSPLFMSPEQVNGDPNPDARSDIYSIGVVAYYLLTGVAPFDQANPMQVMMAHTRDEPVPPAQHDANIPSDLEEIVLRCLEKDPDHRFQDAASLRQALEQCQTAGTWTRQMAIDWWECHGCPKKRALDRSVLLEVSA